MPLEVGTTDGQENISSFCNNCSMTAMTQGYDGHSHRQLRYGKSTIEEMIMEL